MPAVAPADVELDLQVQPARVPRVRRKLIEWLSFVATELHQQVLGPVFDKDAPAACRDDAMERLLPPVRSHIELELAALGADLFLTGETPSGADAYLFWALLLLRHHDPKLIEPASAQFLERMSALAFVRDSVAAETKAMAATSR